jgi:hypothetical protein
MLGAGGHPARAGCENKAGIQLKKTLFQFVELIVAHENKSGTFSRLQLIAPTLTV